METEPSGGKRLTKAQREDLIRKMTKEMQAAARILDFETAAYYRDKIAELRDGSHGGSAADKTRKKRKGP